MLFKGGGTSRLRKTVGGDLKKKQTDITKTKMEVLFSLRRRRRPSLYRCGPWKRHCSHCFLTLLNRDHSQFSVCFLPPTEKLWSLKDRKRRSLCFSHLACFSALLFSFSFLPSFRRTFRRGLLLLLLLLLPLSHLSG